MRMFSDTVLNLEPYVPGEQPKDMRYIKLNTNESPYPPCPEVKTALDTASYADLRLYSDPTGSAFRLAIAETLGVEPNMVLAGGGSDEILSFAFMAFFNKGDKVCYPSVTYGFYRVLAKLFALNPVEMPLDSDFNVNYNDYLAINAHIVAANPNAPTGIAASPDDIERVLAANPDRLFIADEAYIHFSNNKSCGPLLKRHKNLLIVRTLSKSYAMAGMRLGYALGAPELISALERIKNSFNPYNLDRLSILTGVAAIRNTAYLNETVKKVIKTRDETRKALETLNFQVLPSETNFLFARHKEHDGETLYKGLKKSGILVRHFNKHDISDFIRVSIGTDNDMRTFIKALEEIL